MDEALGRLAATQEGVFTVEQIADCGLSPSGTWNRTQSGRLYRVHARVYSLSPPALLSREGRWLAAVLACGPGAVLSHRSAAALHGLRPTDRSGIDVTIPHRSSRKHEGVDVHRSTTLTAQDVTIVQGIPCTTIARTILDIAEVIRQRQLERVFDQAEQEEVLNFDALQEQIDRNPTRAGANRIRAMMENRTVGVGVPWSKLERDFKAMIAAAGLPIPLVNQFVLPGDGEPAIRPDFYWPAHGVIVQTDGWKSHRTWWAFQNDRRNDQRLIAAGYQVIRITYKQIQEEADRLVALISTMLGVTATRRSRAPGP